VVVFGLASLEALDFEAGGTKNPPTAQGCRGNDGATSFPPTMQQKQPPPNHSLASSQSLKSANFILSHSGPLSFSIEVAAGSVWSNGA